jgi:hypothetical protein
MYGWMRDAYLFDVGWLFFAAWSVIVAAVSLAAFGRDLFPSGIQSKPVQDGQPIDPAPSQGTGGLAA